MIHSAFCLPEELVFLEPTSNKEITAVKEFWGDSNTYCYNLFDDEEYIGCRIDCHNAVAPNKYNKEKLFLSACQQLERLLGMYMDET